MFFERWLEWRERLLGNRRFQRWAAAFPLTRPVATRRAQELFDLCAGFVYSQTLLACVQLRVFERLRGDPHTVAALAEQVGLPFDSMSRLVDAGIALRLLERRSADRVGLGPHGAALLANDAVLPMIEHHTMLYADLADPVALLRGRAAPTALSCFWAYARSPQPATLGAASVARYSTLMSSSQPLVAADILEAYPLSKHRRLLDVGGGDGAFAVSAATRNPNLRCVVFDLPAVAARARQRFAEAACRARIVAVDGDFLVDSLPRGADVVTLVRVVHDHDDTSVARLLREIHVALADGGTLLIAEPLSGTAGAARVGDAYFGLYLLAMGSGRPRTAERLLDMVSAAGFVYARELRSRHPMQVRIIAAQKSVNQS